MLLLLLLFLLLLLLLLPLLLLLCGLRVPVQLLCAQPWASCSHGAAASGSGGAMGNDPSLASPCINQWHVLQQNTGGDSSKAFPTCTWCH
jgi:hypothetical protein